MAVTVDQIVSSGLAAPHLLGHKLTGGRYRLYPHVCYIGREIAKAVAKGDSRLIINLGPRWGKSELISYWTPAWFETMWPHKRVMIGCNSNPLASLYGGRVRNLFNEHPSLGVEVCDDSSAKAQWLTSRGGGMKAIGVDEAAFGFGADLFIIDDPYATWADAQSPTTRKGVLDWYTATAESRLEPNATVIVLHHRLHPNDLTNALTTGPDGERWKVISLPSLALENDPMGRKPGESLCEERYSAAQLRAKQKSMRGMFEPMHQQNALALAAGGAYSRFGPHNIDNTVAFRPDLPLHLSVDFNIAPGMHVMLGQFDPIADQAWTIDEIHASRMSVEGACAELPRRLSALDARPTKIEVFGDPAGSSKWAGTGQSQYDILAKGLQPLGIETAFRVANSHPPVVDRVNTFNYTLKDIDTTVRYRVHPRCERLIRDLAAVQLDAKGGIDKSDPDLTHASDGEGYRIHELRGFGSFKQPDAPFIF